MTTEELQSPEEIIQVIKKTEQDRIARATTVERLVTAEKRWRGHELKLEPLKEPIMLFGRRDRSFEILEGVTQGVLEFTHSTGDKRFIIVNPATQCTFGVGRSRLRGYWGHEDYPVTGWPDPTATTEQVNIIIDKTLNDIKKWLATEKKAIGEMWLKIGLGTAAVILAYFLGKGLFGSTQPQIIYQTINDTAKQTANAIINTTPVIR